MDGKPSCLSDACLQTLRYFGIFRYPLTAAEIFHFSGVVASLSEVDETLSGLLKEGAIFRSGDFFLPEDKQEWINERIKGNERAFQLLGKSGRYASIIASFPFVRGIAISGSLSKYYASENPDIDYFIVTDAERLWIARSLLHLFKKFTFLTGHQHYFCMNYFIDTKALKITHPNLYTSIEMATLLPVYNRPVLEEFAAENKWVREYLPNHPGMVDLKYLLKPKNQWFKKMSEAIIQCLFPDRINRALMNLTDSKWRRKWKRAGYPEQEYDRAFMTTVHISKNHPVDYQKKVMSSMVEHQKSESQSI